MSEIITTPGGKLLTPTYPILAYAPGNYTCTCCICKNDFFGDKRAVMCEHCAIEKQYPGGVKIGTLTLKEGRVDFVDFDPEPFVRTDKIMTTTEGPQPIFIDYQNYKNYFLSAQDSFLSLIAASNGIYFFNPMGTKGELEKCTMTAKERVGEEYYNQQSPHYWDNERYGWAIETINKKHDEDLAEWQSYQDNLVKKLAVILMK